MARTSNLNSANTQFYFVVTPAHHLDGQYAVFGQIVKGIDVANNLTQGDSIVYITIEHDPY